jgi:phosphoribosylformylglycinamidine synthase
VHIGVVTFPGSNCDHDVRRALRLAGGQGLTVSPLWHAATALDGVDAVVLPGGFSYGDYLRAGAMAAQAPLMQAVRRFADAGGPVLGICNGFQILCEAGLLPGALTRNQSLHFECKDVLVSTLRATVWTRTLTRGQRLRLPIAHAEGRFVIDHPEALLANRQVAFRYCDADGTPADPGHPANPNGSLLGIAGVCNERGNVLGLMPHPERATDVLAALDGRADGLHFFGSLRADSALSMETR